MNNQMFEKALFRSALDSLDKLSPGRNSEQVLVDGRFNDRFTISGYQVEVFALLVRPTAHLYRIPTAWQGVVAHQFLVERFHNPCHMFEEIRWFLKT
jgi:hypothetical protein